MIINIDYDDDHGFDDGDNDVTSSPPSSTDHLWWYLGHYGEISNA